MRLRSSNTLRVPGADLYYEIRGGGPLLLLIHGAGGDARSFDGTANHLASQYTVITYDRRGLSRSRLSNPDEEQQVETHSDDASRLLAQLSTAPALVLGSSGGAVIGLDLATRFPERVHTLIAHEPPSHLVQGTEERYETIRKISHHEGAASAVQKLMELMRVDYGDLEREVEFSEPRNPVGENPVSLLGVKNTLFFIEHEFAMYERYQFDFATLRSASARTRIVLAAGRDGQQYLGYRNTKAIADRLGTSIVEFPGRHWGYMSHPKDFAETLQNVLGLRS